MIGWPGWFHKLGRPNGRSHGNYTIVGALLLCVCSRCDEVVRWMQGERDIAASEIGEVAHTRDVGGFLIESYREGGRQTIQRATLNRRETVEHPAHGRTVDPGKQSQKEVCDRSTPVRGRDRGQRCYAGGQAQQITGQEVARVETTHTVSYDVYLPFRKALVDLCRKRECTVLDLTIYGDFREQSLGESCRKISEVIQAKDSLWNQEAACEYEVDKSPC